MGKGVGRQSGSCPVRRRNPAAKLRLWRMAPIFAKQHHNLQDSGTVSQTPVDQSHLPFWKRSHYLDRMTLADLIPAYFQHYTIMVYLAVVALCVVGFSFYPAGLWPTLGSIAAAVIIYPLVWHLLHQYVLHGQWMYKIKWLSATWKRIHYDHHQDPNHLEVLFGALHTTLPTTELGTKL